MANSRKRILILGAGDWQQPYIVKARELGFEVYATDWSKDAPGAKYADVFEPIDLKAAEATLQFAAKHRVSAVLTAADIGVPTAALVAERLGLRYHSRELALKATDKFEMRKAAQLAGLSVPRFCAVGTREEGLRSAEFVGFPLIVKPADNCSSRGVTYVPNPEALPSALEDAFCASRSNRVLLEEFMRGVEGSVEAIIVNGKPLILGVCDKVKSPLPCRYDLQLIYPGKYSAHQWEQIQSFTECLAGGLSIQHGVIHVEIMVTEGGVRLIEFAIRGCGSKVVTHLIPAMTGFDVVKHLILDAFGTRSEVQLTRNFHGILKFIMVPQGRLKSISGIEEMRATPGVVEADIERRVGDLIGEIRDGRSRPGHVLAVGASRGEVEATASSAIAKLRMEYQSD